LIGFINSCQEVLKDDGVLSLVVPDARFCFDCFRPLTGISKVIDAHLQKNKMPTVGTVAEYALNIVFKDSSLTWEGASATKGSYSFHSTPEESKKMIEAAGSGEYVDCHCWCFTPSSFRLLINDLNSLGFIELKEVAFSPTEGCEFYISLSKCGELPKLDRLDYLKKINEETWVDVRISQVVKERIVHKKNYLLNRFPNSLRYRWSLLTEKVGRKSIKI
jgi:hypothetical protein